LGSTHPTGSIDLACLRGQLRASFNVGLNALGCTPVTKNWR
jgi:hypothetical protein